MAILVIVVVAVVAFSAWIWFWLRPPQPSTTILEPLDIGRVFSGGVEAFAILGWPMLIFGILIVGLPHLAQDYVYRFMLAPRAKVGAISPLGMIGISYAMQFVTGAIAIVFNIPTLIRVVSTREDRPVTLRNAMAETPRLFFPILAVHMLFALGCAVGFLAFIVPGIIVFLSWNMVSVACIVEGHGIFASFSRSRELTFGSRWRILLLLILVGVAGGLVGSVGILCARFSPTTPWLPVLWNGILSVPLIIFGLGINASLYTELRRSREGITSPGLVEVFS